jgi:hypothetical protein
MASGREGQKKPDHAPTVPTKWARKRDEKRTALLPEMTKENMSFAIAGVLSDNSRFQSENDIKSMTKPTKVAL